MPFARYSFHVTYHNLKNESRLITLDSFLEKKVFTVSPI
jgi:hypothetical protein